MIKKLTDYTTLTFDCYGTLIDWESGIWDAFQPLMMRNNAEKMNRQSVLQIYAEVESAQQFETPDMLYPEILRRVHHDVAQRLDFITSESMDRDFSQSVPYWPAFPDTADALRILKRRFKLVILSNINNASFAAANQKLGVEFDAIYTAETIGSYKPNHANFEYMFEKLSQMGIQRQQILHTAQSLFHDHVPAKHYGMSCAWIDRQGLNDNEDWGATAKVEQRPKLDYIFSNMGEMAAAAENS